MKVIMLRSNPIDPDVRIEKRRKRWQMQVDVILLGWRRFGSAPIREERGRYIIRRLNFRAPVGKGIFFLPIWWIFVFFWLLRNDWNVVHAADLDTYIPALLAAKIKRKRIIYDIFDFYVDMVKLPSYVRNCVAALDVFLMRFADVLL